MKNIVKKFALNAKFGCYFFQFLRTSRPHQILFNRVASCASSFNPRFHGSLSQIRFYNTKYLPRLSLNFFTIIQKILGLEAIVAIPEEEPRSQNDTNLRLKYPTRQLCCSTWIPVQNSKVRELGANPK